jgi:RNA polymerase sigma-70 factor (ECF subfamily)
MAATALAEHLLENRAPLLRFLRARGTCDAEDLFQDLWLKTDRLAVTTPMSDPRAYLFRMADNLAHDRVRTEMRRTAREHGWSDLFHGVGGHDQTPSAERALDARQRLRRVERALAALSDRTQAIFRRFRLEGMSQVDIAREDGISLSAVEKHLQRAYRVLAALAAEDDAEAAGPSRPC